MEETTRREDWVGADVRRRPLRRVTSVVWPNGGARERNSVRRYRQHYLRDVLRFTNRARALTPTTCALTVGKLWVERIACVRPVDNLRELLRAQNEPRRWELRTSGAARQREGHAFAV